MYTDAPPAAPPEAFGPPEPPPAAMSSQAPALQSPVQDFSRQLVDAGIPFRGELPGPKPAPSDQVPMTPEDEAAILRSDARTASRGAAQLEREAKRPEIQAAYARDPGAFGGISPQYAQATGLVPPPAAPTLAGAGGPPGGMQLQMPAQPRFIPASYERTRDPIREKTYTAIDKAMQSQADADIAKNRALETGYVVQAEHQDALAREYENTRLNYQAREQERNQRFEAGRSYATNKAAEVGNFKVRPFRMLQDADAGTKFAVILGGILGGVVQGLKGGKNPFLEQLDATIQKDIDAQNQQLGAKKFAADVAQTELGQIRAKLGDERAADLTVADMAYAQIENQAKAALARTSSQTAQANGERLLADLAARRAEIQAQRDQRMYVAAHTAGGGAGAMSKDKALLFTGLDGKTYKAQTPESYNKISTQLGYVTNIQANINQALAIRKNASVADLANPYSSVSKQLKSLQGETAQIVTVARGQGAMSKGDQAVADEAIGSMGGMLSNNDEVLASTRDRWAQQMGREIRATGAEEIERGYTVDARGNVVPDPAYVGASAQPKSQGMPAGAKKIGGP